jgi:Tfp pilus assembly pilus retraction ATPase PilT
MLAAIIPELSLLLGDSVVKEKIREGEDTDLPAVIAGSRESGMQSFTNSLADLIEQGLIYTDVAMEYAPNREALKGMLKGIKTSAQLLVSRIKRGGGGG